MLESPWGQREPPQGAQAPSEDHYIIPTRKSKIDLGILTSSGSSCSRVKFSKPCSFHETMGTLGFPRAKLDKWSMKDLTNSRNYRPPWGAFGWPNLKICRKPNEFLIYYSWGHSRGPNPWRSKWNHRIFFWNYYPPKGALGDPSLKKEFEKTNNLCETTGPHGAPFWILNSLDLRVRAVSNFALTEIARSRNKTYHSTTQTLISWEQRPAMA